MAKNTLYLLENFPETNLFVSVTKGNKAVLLDWFEYIKDEYKFKAFKHVTMDLKACMRVFIYIRYIYRYLLIGSDHGNFKITITYLLKLSVTWVSKVNKLVAWVLVGFSIKKNQIFIVKKFVKDGIYTLKTK